MLSKCAAPSCSAPFRYLTEGRLFRLELDPLRNGRVIDNAGRLLNQEYFWLCDSCCKVLKLHLDKDGDVVAVSPVDKTHPDHLRTFIIARHSGKLLRCINFFGKQF